MTSPEPFVASLRTDQGRVRDHNEDFVDSYIPASLEEEQRLGRLYIVADGVGGADAGEVASRFATEQTIAHYLAADDDGDLGQRLVQAMYAANHDLRQMVVEQNDNKRMATTMVNALILGDHLYLANVGDSRGYLLRDETLEQVTKDQSLVAKLLEEGAITEEEAVNHPHRNVILYSIGSEKKPRIDLFELTLQAGDRVILCSDGLTRHVEDNEIKAYVSEFEPGEATERLIALANERGGQDNISAVVIRFNAPITASETATELEPVTGVETVTDLETVAEPASEADTQRLPTLEVSEPAPVTVAEPVAASAAPNHRFMRLYTLFLAIVEAVLIVLAWLWLA